MGIYTITLGKIVGDTLTKPAILKDHLYPMFGFSIKWLIRIGHTTPPTDEPEYKIPIATARFRRNQ